MNQSIPLTESDRDDIKRMLAEGYNYKQVAEWIGCGESTVRRHAKHLGVSSIYRRIPDLPVVSKTQERSA